MEGSSALDTLEKAQRGLCASSNLYPQDHNITEVKL